MLDHLGQRDDFRSTSHEAVLVEVEGRLQLGALEEFCDDDFRIRLRVRHDDQLSIILYIRVVIYRQDAFDLETFDLALSTVLFEDFGGGNELLLSLAQLTHDSSSRNTVGELIKDNLVLATGKRLDVIPTTDHDFALTSGIGIFGTFDSQDRAPCGEVWSGHDLHQVLDQITGCLSCCLRIVSECGVVLILIVQLIDAGFDRFDGIVRSHV